MNTKEKQLKIFNKILNKEQRTKQRHCLIEFLKMREDEEGRICFFSIAQLEVSDKEELKKLIFLMEEEISCGLQYDVGYLDIDEVPYAFTINQVFSNKEDCKRILGEVEDYSEIIEYIIPLINKYIANIDLKGNEVSSISLNFPLWWCNEYYDRVKSANPDFDDSEIKAFSILHSTLI
ncbi:MAG: hypothetical protein Q3983_07525, partial [Capnocytophaga sp.]|nr:hypothetical protein [Capnocytophaga sp.]